MMSALDRGSIAPLMISLVGLGTLIAACSVLLLPYDVYRWARRTSAWIWRRAGFQP